MGELMALLVTSVLVNNVILTQFLGMCPFMGVSKKKSSAIGMGVAVVFVIVVAALVTYALYYLVLVLLQLIYGFDYIYLGHRFFSSINRNVH